MGIPRDLGPRRCATCRLLAGLSLWVAGQKSNENPQAKRRSALHGRIWAPYMHIIPSILCFFGSTLLKSQGFCQKVKEVGQKVKEVDQEVKEN